jgi:hypothetical protein
MILVFIDPIKIVYKNIKNILGHPKEINQNYIQNNRDMIAV